MLAARDRAAGAASRAAILRAADEAGAGADATTAATAAATAGSVPAPVAGSGASRRLFGRARPSGTAAQAPAPTVRPAAGPAHHGARGAARAAAAAGQHRCRHPRPPARGEAPRTRRVATPRSRRSGRRRARRRLRASATRLRYRGRMTPEVLWAPAADARARSRMGALPRLARGDRAAFASRPTTRPGAGRSTTRGPSGESSGTTSRSLADGRRMRASPTRAMPGARWFPGATLNYAEHALRLPAAPPDDVVVIGRSQTRGPVDADRGRAARRGRPLPGRARARSAFGRATASRRSCRTSPRRSSRLLATASLGAIWSSCAPEFGTRAVIDRFGQIEPRVLLAVDGYRYGDRDVDRTAELAEIRAALPTPRGDGRRCRTSIRRRARPAIPGALRLGRRCCARAGAARRSSRSRSTTRSTSSTRRGRPACQADRPRPRRDPPRAPQGARPSTPTSGRRTGSAGSRRPAG